MQDVPAIWREFVAYHVSMDFYREIVSLFGDQIRRAHPNLDEKLAGRIEDLTVGRSPSTASLRAE
jgi:hypothetical protein